MLRKVLTSLFSQRAAHPKTTRTDALPSVLRTRGQRATRQTPPVMMVKVRRYSNQISS